MRIFAVLNFVGILLSAVAGVLLLYAMPLQRTNYRLVESKTHEVAMCFNEMKVEAGYGGPLVVSDEACPDGVGPSITPAIQYEHPAFLTVGLWLLALGFAFQVPAGVSAIKKP